MNGTNNLMELNLTGDSNIGGLYRLMLLQKGLTVYEQVVYMTIGRYSLGYCRKNTNVPADKGYNRNSKAWATDMGISKTSFLRAVKSLAERKLITVHSGSAYRKDGGSYPDYYSIKYDGDLQKKHGIYFNADGVKSSKANATVVTKHEPEPIVLPNPEHYTWLHNIIRPLFDENGEPNTTHDFLIGHSTLSIDHPTQDELNKHKGLT